MILTGTKLRRLATLSALATALAACEGASDESGVASEKSEVARSKTTLDRLRAARELGSPGGSAITDNEAHEVAWSLCPDAYSSGSMETCGTIDAALAGELDDLAVQARVDADVWHGLNAVVVGALRIARAAASPTKADWPARKEIAHERPVPVLALHMDPYPGPWGALGGLLQKYGGTVLQHDAVGVFDAEDKLIAFRLHFVFNTCNGCEDDLEVAIGLDGTILEERFLPATGYCC